MHAAFIYCCPTEKFMHLHIFIGVTSVQKIFASRKERRRRATVENSTDNTLP